ncbi:LysR substrate-binding domain-containing protein [Pseudomonas aeruginosa]
MCSASRRPLPREALIGLSTADPLFARLEDYLSAVEPPPQVKIAVQTYALARALVEAGAGLALVDPFTALGADPHSTAIRPLSPAFPVTLYAITRADETPPHTLAPLLRMLARQAEERLRAVQM